MPIGAVAGQVLGQATAMPILEIIAGATCSIVLLRLAFSVPVAVASQVSAYGLGQPAAAGVGPRTGFLPEQGIGVSGYDTGSSFQLATAWNTAPTAPTNFYRRISRSGAGAVMASQVAFTFFFTRGLVIPPTITMVLWQITEGTSSGVFATPSVDFWLEFAQ